MPKPEKVEFVRELMEDLSSAKGLLVTDYRGLKVSEITELRKKLRDTGASYKVVKNTLFHLAAKDRDEVGLDPYLEGPTGIAFAGDDVVKTAKVLVDFAKTHKTMALKAGFLEGHVYDADQVVALSKIPPREQLVAQMVGSIAAPLSGFVGTLQGVLSGLVYTLQAVADQKAA